MAVVNREPRRAPYEFVGGLEGAAVALLRAHNATLVLLTYVCLGLLFSTPAEDLASSWAGPNWWMLLLVVLVVLVSACLTFLMASRSSRLWLWIARGVTSIAPVLALAYLIFLR